ncbi:MAG: holo-ACP synthase [bacterium]
MILGVGLDLMDVSRLQRDLQEKEGLRAELFTPVEIETCLHKRYPAQHFTARFCAKEALFKALGIGKRGKMSWQDIEISNDAAGKPQVTLSGETRQCAARLGVSRIHLSLSHIRTAAVAVIILETDKPIQEGL